MIDPSHPHVASDLAAGETSPGNTESPRQEVINNLITLLTQKPVRNLCHEYEADRRLRDVDLGFNPFGLVSDLYYRENLHSDVLAAILDPHTKHKCEGAFLDKFLDFLIEANPEKKINKTDYRNSQVVREENRIDILIKDNTSPHAIIVENKINNAPDMYRQIPRYVADVVENRLTVDAIVYISLCPGRQPDRTDWTADERREIDAKLCCVAAATLGKGEPNLCTGWLNKCKSAAEPIDPEAYYLLKHYIDLITKLAANAMNKDIMKQFYEIMQADGWANFKTAQSIKAMLDGMVDYRIDRVVDHFREQWAFGKIENYKHQCAVFKGCLWQKKAHFSIEVKVEPSRYRFEFLDRNDPDGSTGRALLALKRMDCVDQYKKDGNRFFSEFDFPLQEEELFRHITEFIFHLKEAFKGELQS